MTRYEAETCTAITRNLPAIAIALEKVAKEMKIANDLKALELKGEQHIMTEMVDGILDTRSK